MLACKNGKKSLSRPVVLNLFLPVTTAIHDPCPKAMPSCPSIPSFYLFILFFKNTCDEVLQFWRIKALDEVLWLRGTEAGSDFLVARVFFLVPPEITPPEIKREIKHTTIETNRRIHRSIGRGRVSEKRESDMIMKKEEPYERTCQNQMGKKE